ncbi:histidinol-phosphate transaminase [Buchnera aphidicola]|uniref:histidinol-phosphate transaminase n=1 Tax=Buchnera aphidicola TaxID=9 RepID=UPI002092487E|nr:histidinol-phosphate transaminase [Buchnera aphidicola]USS94202.1 histidinol-phosphate transaminase [Buchnera aphidicola (Sipha maydis)]WII23750.1 histidinol-phosphate transaminase [Buchnera aphidicola (Sipha maydis)]
MININKFVRKNIKKLIPYQSARRIGGVGKIWLNANESPFRNNKNLFCKNLNRYPDQEYHMLLDKYSRYANVLPENILATRGSDEAIELIIKAFCNPGKDKIMFFPPTYDMYKIYADILCIKISTVLQLKNFQLNINSIKKKYSSVKIIFICNPNNPTGNTILSQDIIDILEFFKKKCLVVIDEAYIDFCLQETSIMLLNRFSNLIILRTLSKAFGLASIRCGFLISNERIINIINKIIAPYPLGTPILNIALDALTKSNISVIKNNIFNLIENKNFLITKLKKHKFIKKIYPSKTNFILIKFFSSKDVFNLLSQFGIITRDQNFKIFLKNCIRISIGTYEECLNLVNILKKIEK